MDEYIIQYTVLEKVEDQGQEKIKLMVAAVPSEVVESYYGLAKALGLKVAFVDYAGNSTYQIMKQQIGPEVSLVIQVENDGTVINIFKDNVLQLQRNVPYGKSMLVNAVMEKYGLKYEAATTKLQNETLLHSRFDGDEVTESLRYMASNINRVIDYYVSRNRLSIQKAYLIGHSTSIKGFATLLSNELNMPIEKVERLKNIALDKKAYVEEATLTSYVTNLGAVIDPVDFIPKRLIESGARKENTKTLIVGFVGALVVSALLVLIPLVQVVALNAEIGSLNKSIKKLSIINDVVNEYYSAKDKYNDIAAFAALTSDSDDALQDFVDYLEKSMPSDITIQSFNVASGAITVNGTAGSKSSVAKFIQELQKNSSVLNVDAPTITETKDNAGTIEVTFSLSCTFVGGTSNTTDMKSSNTSNSTKNSSTKSSTTK
jgi:type IV pilus assembly protein PilN